MHLKVIMEKGTYFHCQSCHKNRKYYKDGLCESCYEISKKNVNALRVVDIDLVRELRAVGRFSSANEIIRAYHNELKKIKKDELSSILRRDILIKRQFGYCVNGWCRNPAVEKHFCEGCLKTKKEYKKNSILK